MFWMLPLAGAVIGGLANKRNPLQGAIMGAGIGATGGALAPAMMGGAAAAGGAAGSAAAGGTAAGSAGLMGPMMQTGASSALPGLQSYLAASPSAGSGLLGTLKPLGQYANMAQQTGVLGGGQEEPGAPAPAPVVQGGSGPQTLAQIAQNDGSYQTAEEAAMRRRRRRELLERVA